MKKYNELNEGSDTLLADKSLAEDGRFFKFFKADYIEVEESLVVNELINTNTVLADSEALSDGLAINRSYGMGAYGSGGYGGVTNVTGE